VAAHFRLPPEGRSSTLLRDFCETYGDRISPEQRNLVETLLALHEKSWLSRARHAFRSPVFRQSAVDDAILRVLLTLGRF
jgi:hypothetical protein